MAVLELVAIMAEWEEEEERVVQVELCL